MRGQEELDAASLLAGRHILSCPHSPTGRSEMEQSGIELAFRIGGGLGQRVFDLRHPRGRGGADFSEQAVRPQLISNGY